MSLGAALATALTATLLAPHASAHGGFPRAFEIIVEPGNPADIVLRSDLWGFFHSTDGGTTWQWTCAEVYSSSSLNVDHRNMVLMPGGRLLVANEFKGLRLTDDFCSWSEVADLHGQLVADVALAGTSPFVLTSTYVSADGGNGHIDGSLWESTDGGTHFARVGKSLPGQFAGASMGLSPKDSKRVYVVGRIIEAPGGVVETSTDGGTTWKEFSLPITNDTMTLRVAAVHPTRPEVAFVWGDLPEGYGEDAPDEIWGTTDGGATWSKVFTGIGDLPGFAISPDGTELMIAGPKDGLHRAKLDDALTQGKSAFVQDFSRQVWGLHWTDAGLTAGTDNFAAKGIPAFTYGSSADEGKSFTEVMGICDVKFDACTAGSDVQMACNSVYDNTQGGFSQDFTHGARCVAAPDAGSKTATGPTSSGCTVALPTHEDTRGTGAGIAALFLSALGLGALRRSRR